MDKRKYEHNNIKQAIDATFSGVTMQTQMQYRVLREVRGEQKVKRKLSSGLVLAIVLMLLSVTALATMMLNTFHQKTIEMEATNGLFSTWTTDDKVSFVNMMSDAGLKVDSAKIARLHNSETAEEEKDQIASQIVTDCFGSGRGGDFTLYDIIALDYGPYETWSIDIKAQVTEELLKYGALGSLYAMDVLPFANEISQDQTVQIAYDMLTSKYNITKAELIAMRMDVYFREIPYGPEETVHRLWQIRFSPFDGDKEYTVDVNSDGTVLDSSEPETRRAEPIMDRFHELLRTDNFWTPEGLAAYAKEWPALLKYAIASGEEVRPLAIYLSQIPYELPNEDALSQENAHEMAEQAILQFPGWTQERLNLYKFSASYRVYTPGHPEWRFGYMLASFDDYARFYAGEIPIGIVVRIDAYSGAVLSIQEKKDMDGSNDYTEFPDHRDTHSSDGVG